MEGIFAAVITGVVAIVVCVINNSAQQKRTRTQLQAQQAETRAQLESQHSKTTTLIDYRLGELEKKVEKHNKVVERLAVVERDLESAFYRVDDIRDEVSKLNERMTRA